MPNFHNVKNNAASTLAAGIGSSDLVLSVAADNFPAAPFFLTVENEIVEVTAKSGTTYTIVRGKDGTAAATHSSGVTVQLLVVADIIRELQAALAAATMAYEIRNPEERVIGGQIMFAAQRTITAVNVSFDRTPDVPVHLSLYKISGATVTNFADFKTSAKSALFDCADTTLPAGDYLQIIKDNDIVPQMTSNSLPAPVAVSSSDASANAYKVFDKDPATTLTIGGTTGSVTADFGSGNTNVVKAFALTIGAVANDSPSAFKLQYSNDGGSTYSDAAAYTGITWTTNQRQYFYTSNTTAGRLWRVAWTAANGTQVTINSLELMLGLDGLTSIMIQPALG